MMQPIIQIAAPIWMADFLPASFFDEKVESEQDDFFWEDRLTVPRRDICGKEDGHDAFFPPHQISLT